MTPSIFRPLASSAFEAMIEDTIFRGSDLYDLDGETSLRRRDGRVETGSTELFEREIWS